MTQGEKSMKPIGQDMLDLGEAPEGLFPDLQEPITTKTDKDPPIDDETPVDDEPKKRGRPKKEKEEKSGIEVDEIETAISTKEETNKREGNEPEDIDEIVSPLVDVVAERWGWEFTEEDKPKTMNEFIELIEKTIDANAKPEYSNEIVEQFDKYMKAGGDPRRFMQVHYEMPEYDKMDVKNVSNQKRIMTDYYRMKGLPDAKIEKLIGKYELDNELEGEAEEAQKELTDLTTKEKETILKRQESERQSREEEQKKNITNVVNHIKNVKDIYGLQVSAREKEELVPYLFKRDADGLTQQQKDFQQDPLGYLTTIAYLYKNREKLKQSINNQVKTDAATALREKTKELKIKARSKSDQGQVSEDNEDWLGSITRRIVKPK